MRVQELFTEFKKIKRRPNTDVANTAPFCEIFPYNRGKCPKNWKNFNWRGKILGTGRSHNPNFGFVARSYDTWGPDRAGFWNFHFSGKFWPFSAQIWPFFGNFAKNSRHKVPKNAGKIKISKSGSIRPSGIMKSRWKTKMGVIGPTSAENFSARV